MHDVQFILAGTDNAIYAEKVEAFLKTNPGWSGQFIGNLEMRGYSYNNAVSHWIEAVAHAFAALAENPQHYPTDYRVMCKARIYIRSL